MLGLKSRADHLVRIGRATGQDPGHDDTVKVRVRVQQRHAAFDLLSELKLRAQAVAPCDCGTWQRP